MMLKNLLVTGVLVTSVLFGCGATAVGMPSWRVAGAAAAIAAPAAGPYRPATQSPSLAVPLPALLPADGKPGHSNPVSSPDIAASGSRAEWVFGWVTVIIALFAGTALVSERIGRA